MPIAEQLESLGYRNHPVYPAHELLSLDMLVPESGIHSTGAPASGQLLS